MKFIIDLEKLKFAWTVHIALGSSCDCSDERMLASEFLACNYNISSISLLQYCHQFRCALFSSLAVTAEDSKDFTMLLSKLLALFEMFLGHSVCLCQN